LIEADIAVALSLEIARFTDCSIDAAVLAKAGESSAA